MKDTTKECQMKFRLTKELKEEILKYCNNSNITASEFIRFACIHIIKEEINYEREENIY